MNLIKKLVLKLSPHLTSIISMRNQMISENASLKLKIIGLEKLINDTSNIDKMMTKTPDFFNACSEDFSVIVFDHKTIPGKK